MSERRASALILCLLLVLCLGCEPAVRERTTIAVDPPAANHVHAGPFVCVYFTGEGEYGLHLATSTDGLAWTAADGGRPVLTPQVGRERLMRDPSMARGPDGLYHLVWAVGWSERVIGYACSADLRAWSMQQAIPVMEYEPAARNAWAPELFYDQRTQQFLIIWASTVDGAFTETSASSADKYNHRLYYTTTRDFRAFAPTRLFYDPWFSVTDACVARVDGHYLLVAKNETPFPAETKTIFLAAARAASGPYGSAGPPISRTGVAGPSLLRVGSQWRIYHDSDGEERYGLLVTRDFRSWVPIDELLRMPSGARRGSMLAVPETIFESLRAGS